MSVAISAPPARFQVHRAPPLDPPFDDELSPLAYRPIAYRPRPALPREALAGASPACEAAAQGFLKVCLELFNGFRSTRQIWPLLHVQHALPVLDELARIQRYAVDLRRQDTRARLSRRGHRICEPRPGAAEAAAVLCDGSRVWALCYRLETQDRVWRCTFLKAALPSPSQRFGPPRRTPRQP